MKTLRLLMTDSSRCSEVPGVLLLLLLIVLPLSAMGQRNRWTLPGYKETVRTASFTVGNSFARDTYLSQSSYDGWAFGLEQDSWTGYKPSRLFRYGRFHSSILFSSLNNSINGGSTLELMTSDHYSFMWPAVESDVCDLLVGPLATLELGVLYNRQNSNNPASAEGYLGAGVCVDNTLRFNLFRHEMALLTTLYLPLAGMGFAPDYDQPYWYIYRYNEYGKALHFITQFNNPSFMGQVALTVPVAGGRVKIGYTLDYSSNRLGGHARRIGSSMFTVGFARRLELKGWNR